MKEIKFISKGETILLLLDDEDFEKYKDYKMFYAAGYVRAYDPIRERWTGLHRLVMDCPDDMIIDHINHNKSDNRKENLRIVDTAGNQHNRLKSKNNTSGLIGVSYDKDRDCWQARICIGGKQLVLGKFETAIEAAVVYNQKAEELGFLTRNTDEMFNRYYKEHKDEL